IWETAALFVAGPSHVDYDYGARQPRWDAVEPFLVWTPDWMNRSLAEEIRKSYDPPPVPATWISICSALYKGFYLLKPLFAFGMVAGLVLLLRVSAHRYFAIMLLLPYVMALAIFALHSTVTARYSDPTITLPLLLAAVGFSVWQRKSEPVTREAL